MTSDLPRSTDASEAQVDPSSPGDADASSAPSRAMITGASRGIGEAFARRLAADGRDLVLVARTEAALEGLAHELSDRHGVDVELLVADLGDEHDLALVEKRLDVDEAPIDLLVNNAGIGSAGAFVDTDVDREHTVIDVNIVALTRLSHALAEALTRRGDPGGIVNVSSITAFQPGPNGSVYAAGKAYVKSFSEALHEELREHGIRVLALCPGFTRTAIFDEADADTGAVPEPLWMEPDQVVDAALKDLRRGLAVSVPGVGYRAMSVLTPRMPGAVTRPAAGWFGERFL